MQQSEESLAGRSQSNNTVDKIAERSNADPDFDLSGVTEGIQNKLTAVTAVTQLLEEKVVKVATQNDTKQATNSSQTIEGENLEQAWVFAEETEFEKRQQRQVERAAEQYYDWDIYMGEDDSWSGDDNDADTYGPDDEEEEE